MVDEYGRALTHSKHGIGLYLCVRWKDTLRQARYYRLGEREVLIRCGYPVTVSDIPWSTK